MNAVRQSRRLGTIGSIVGLLALLASALTQVLPAIFPPEPYDHVIDETGRQMGLPPEVATSLARRALAEYSLALPSASRIRFWAASAFGWRSQGRRHASSIWIHVRRSLPVSTNI